MGNFSKIVIFPDKNNTMYFLNVNQEAIRNYVHNILFISFKDRTFKKQDFSNVLTEIFLIIKNCNSNNL